MIHKTKAEVQRLRLSIYKVNDTGDSFFRPWTMRVCWVFYSRWCFFHAWILPRMLRHFTNKKISAEYLMYYKCLKYDFD